MEIIPTGIKDLVILKPNVHGDHRGYFFESYSARVLKEAGMSLDFIQDNEAMSMRKIFRGFHYQVPPFDQTKLVRVVKGSVLDVVIDIRPESKTYGEHYSIELSAENKLQLFVPRGFAHGYLCLEDETIFTYKVDNTYSREHEHSVSFLDKQLGIDWPIAPSEFIVSDKDKLSPSLGSHVKFE